jgi:hypothetical protein
MSLHNVPFARKWTHLSLLYPHGLHQSPKNSAGQKWRTKKIKGKLMMMTMKLFTHTINLT